MTLSLALPADARPACADPELLPLVDAAFDRTQGRTGAAAATKRLLEVACVRCPVAEQCRAIAMRSNEHGPWAGTTTKARTEHGAAPANHSLNISGLHHRKAS